MSSQPNQSLIDGLACLQQLASSESPIGCRELARQLNINSMKANRLLMTLKSIGLLEQNEKKAYLPGAGIHVLAAQAIHGSSLFNSALPEIEKLTPTMPHIISLGVLWQGKVSYLIHAEPNKPFSSSMLKNHLYDASKSTIGILLLSKLDDDEIQEQIGETRFNKIRDEVMFAREHNYAKKKHKDPLEVTIAVPVGKPVVGALAFSRFRTDCDLMINEKLMALQNLVNTIEELMNN